MEVYVFMNQAGEAAEFTNIQVICLSTAYC